MLRAGGLDSAPAPCYDEQVIKKTRPMLNIQDYGDNGVVPMIESETVQTTVDNIIEYVESRFEILEAQERLGDILALVEEFREWGDAEEGDEISYYTCPIFN